MVQDGATSGLGVASTAYREAQMALNQTAARCSANGVSYEPLVFTVQGGIETRAEALLSRIAKEISEAEGTSQAAVKKEMLEAISVSLARAASKAVLRRRPHTRSNILGPLERYMMEESEVGHDNVA